MAAKHRHLNLVASPPASADTRDTPPAAFPRAGTVLPAGALCPRRLALSPRLEDLEAPPRDLPVWPLRVQPHLEDVVERGGGLGQRRLIRRRNAVSRLDMESGGRSCQLDSGHRSSDATGTDLPRLADRARRRLMVGVGWYQDRVRLGLGLGSAKIW